MHREYQEDDPDRIHSKIPHMPRLLLQEPTLDSEAAEEDRRESGKLSGIYQNVRTADHRHCSIVDFGSIY